MHDCMNVIVILITAMHASVYADVPAATTANNRHRQPVVPHTPPLDDDDDGMHYSDDDVDTQVPDNIPAAAATPHIDHYRNRRKG